MMEKNRYACFSDPSRSIEGDAEPGTINLLHLLNGVLTKHRRWFLPLRQRWGHGERQG